MMMTMNRTTREFDELHGWIRKDSCMNSMQHCEHIYSPIRQTQTEKYRYIQRDTKLNITTHVAIELTQQITNSFMQWNKNSPRALITFKNHERPEYIMQ